ncbi:GNAT family N-acetyltransferase [Salipiger sp. IMCC34102]|uniref:GNAT family N-acetyltransferase n=1 Tax=Salipiger sp. IMCC34102 TaxID=2510647 RepID=UPI00101BE7E1|nr:GNAT family N-acetyltransferase [Salipiger sp. IMCC34102]RYH01590.1 GNAT family N-acetyltransferase [Salipiger sp. IMCC34102]
MHIETIPEWALSVEDDAGIADLLDRAFGPDFGGRSFYKQRHHCRVLCRGEKGRVVGHIAVLMRDIRLGDRLVPITGLAEVATDPDRRGQGLATALLQEAIATSRASLADFIVLFGDRPIYAGHGFVRANNTLTYTVLDDATTHGVKRRVEDTLMVLPVGSAQWDFAAPVDLLGHLF